MNGSLKSALDQFRLEFAHKVPPEIAAAMSRADEELAATGIAGRALSAGQIAPDFELKDAQGQNVSLRKLLGAGPVVVSFYRGGWCPYCNIELRALQSILPQIEARGARLVAISPELPDESLSTAERNALAFPVLSDIGSRVAREWGIAFDLAEELRPIYAELGHALPERNGGTDWVLPIPATFVIARDGLVQLAFVDSNYRNRLELSAVLAALDSLAQAAVLAV
ncbi:MAG: peroxiredoxin-like family protein [Novosphingobium sp.]